LFEKILKTVRRSKNHSRIKFDLIDFGIGEGT